VQNGSTIRVVYGDGDGSPTVTVTVKLAPRKKGDREEKKTSDKVLVNRAVKMND
jgi:hypothetical protein